MTLLLTAGSRDAGLPSLSGKLALAYKACWILLAFAAAAMLAVSFHQATVHAAVLALRIVKAAIVVSVCGILLRRRATDPVAALLSLALLIWTVTSSFDFATADRLPQLLDRLRFLLFVLALLLFPDGSWQPRWTRNIAAASASVFLLGAVETLGLLPTRFFLPLAIACVLAAIASLIARFRTAETGTVRQQLKWIALGLVSGVGLILTARAGAALAHASATTAPMPVLWEAMFQLGIVAVALGFLVSLLRYRLFDAEAAISRSAALAGLTIAMVATFAGTEAAIEWLGEQYLGMGIGNVSAAMAAAVAAVLLNPLHNRISNWAESNFQHDLVLLKRNLPEVLIDLSASATPRQLGEEILRRITDAIHTTRSALIAPDGMVVAAKGASPREVERWVEARPGDRGAADLLFPVRLALRCPVTGRTGWLALGPRLDGSAPGKDDVEALESLCPMIRQALAWTEAREAARKRALHQARVLRRHIAGLERRVAALEGLEMVDALGLEPRTR